MRLNEHLYTPQKGVDSPLKCSWPKRQLEEKIVFIGLKILSILGLAYLCYSRRTVRIKMIVETTCAFVLVGFLLTRLIKSTPHKMASPLGNQMIEKENPKTPVKASYDFIENYDQVNSDTSSGVSPFVSMEQKPIFPGEKQENMKENDHVARNLLSTFDEMALGVNDQ